MDTRYDFGPETGDRIVYVRPVAAKDLPADVRAQLGDAPNIFAVHSPNGDRLALVRDRKLAFALARQNDMTPVNVH